MCSLSRFYGVLLILTRFSSRARADFARNRLGWVTKRGLDDFLNHFDEEVEAMRGELSA